MDTNIQVTFSTSGRSGCPGEACPKRQAGECGRKVTGPPLSEELEKKENPVTARVERRSKLRLLVRQNEGQSLVEFAMAVPILLLVVTGIMAFGIAFNNYMMLTEATSVGARQLTVSRGQTLDPCNTFASAVYGAAPLLKKANLTFTLSLNGTPYTGTSCASSTTASGAPANMVLGTNAVMTVTYPVSVSVFGMKIISAGSLLTAQTTELMQ